MKTLSSYLEMDGGLDGEEGIGRKDGGGGGGGVHANQTPLNLHIWGMSVHGEGRGDKQLCLFHLAGIRGSVPPSPSPPASSDVNQLFAGSARIKDNPLGGGVEAGVGGGAFYAHASSGSPRSARQSLGPFAQCVWIS